MNRRLLRRLLSFPGITNLDSLVKPGDCRRSLDRPFVRAFLSGDFLFFFKNWVFLRFDMSLMHDAGDQDSKTGWGSWRPLVFAVFLALGIRTFAYEPFNIPSGSMIPTLLVGDYLFVSKMSYGYSRYSLPFGFPLISGRIFTQSPESGDVAVFKTPADNKTDYIKRIIGLPGDELQIRNGILYLNGQPVRRDRVGSYRYQSRFGYTKTLTRYRETLPNGVSYDIVEESDNRPLDNTSVYRVPEEHYFALGDNRDNSTDSRVPGSHQGVGFIPVDNLVGRADFIFFSTNGSARFWQFWKWPFAIRYDRLLQPID